MNAHTQPSLAPAAPTGLRAAAGLTLLTWPALEAAGVDAAVTARGGGVSSGPYATLNLSFTVGDDPARVLENRRRLAAAFGADPGDFVFARQVHGPGVAIVGEADRGKGVFTLDDAVEDTDALVTRSPGVVLAILAADCVPIVLYDPVAGVLACVHAGWRGTVARVCAATIAAMQSLGSHPSDVIAGVGPAVAPARYQVGPDVHQAVTQAFSPTPSSSTTASSAAPSSSTVGPSSSSAAAPSSSTAAAEPSFIRPDPAAPGHWLLDLWSANRYVLREAGLPDHQIHITNLPTGLADPKDTIDTANSKGPADSGSPTALSSPGYFFSDRVARPCGRLALVARLRAPGRKGMDVTSW